MADRLPLLIFPRPISVNPPKGQGFPPQKPHLPGHARQVERLGPQLTKLQKDFSHYKAMVSEGVAGFEPETVLVIETIGRVEDFKRAIEKTDGLEWLGEWDIEEIDPDEDFYEIPKIGVDFFKKKITSPESGRKKIRDILKECEIIKDDGQVIAEDLSKLSLPADLAFLKKDIVDAITNIKKAKSLAGRLFLSMANQRGMDELLSLWKQWVAQKRFSDSKTKWRDIFGCIKNIRRWGMEETLVETGMKEYFENLLDNQTASFQIECFYHQKAAKRRSVANNIKQLISDSGGELISQFIDKPEICISCGKSPHAC